MMTPKAKLILLLLASTFIIYSNSLGGEFLSDDSYFIVKNVAIRNLANIPSFFTNPQAVAFSALAEDVYRPVTATSYAVDYFISFLNTFWYHLENVLLHAMNAILLFLILTAITGDLFVAFFASLFFACHPVQTEVVSWISGRSSVLFLFFYLAALLFYIRSRQGGAGVRDLVFSSGLYLVALFSKEMAVTLPLLIIVYDIHFGTQERWSARLARYLPYIALTAFFIIVRSQVLPRMSQGGWWGGTPYTNILSSLASLPSYARLLLYPVELCGFYMPLVARSIAETRVLAALGIVGLVLVAAPVLYRRSKPASFALWWFFVTILPVANLVPLKALMADRFLYIPSIGFCILAAILIGQVRRLKVRHALVIASLIGATIAVLYAARTMYRNEDWKNAISLSKSIVRTQPLNAWGWTSLGTSYIGREQFTEAIPPLKKAISLSRDYSAPRVALGFCYLQLRDFPSAVVMFKEALHFEPKNLEALISLGVSLAELKQHDEAIARFQEAIRIDPSFVSAYLNLGTAYEQTGQDEKAREAYEAILSRTNSPLDVGIAYIRLGDLRLRQDDKAGALAYYQKALAASGDKSMELKQIVEDRIKRMP